MDVLIGARVVQGIGAAGMFTMSAIVIVEMTQPRQRAGWTSLSQAFGAVGNICGPLAAGLMCKGSDSSWVSALCWFSFAGGLARIDMLTRNENTVARLHR